MAAPAIAAPALPYLRGRNCADRASHTNPPPCSTRARAGGLPAHRNSHWRKTRCCHNIDHPTRAPRVCGSCANETVNTAWHQQARIDAPDFAHPGNDPYTPPATAAPATYPTGTDAAWTGFLTRLCRSCEHIEQQKLHEFLNNPGSTYSTANRAVYMNMSNAGGAHEWPRTGVPVSFPRNTCICPSYLGRIGPRPGVGGLADDRWCYDHRKSVWDEIVEIRNQSDAWLRTTARDAKGQLCMASARRMRTRNSAKSKSYRACRCGGEVDTLVHPHGTGPRPRRGAEVWMCMACEGLVHVVDPGTVNSLYQGPWRPARAFAMENDDDNHVRAAAGLVRGRGDQSLFRERMEHTA